MSENSPRVLRQAQGDKLIIFCPACECGHAFDKRWTWNGDVVRPTFSPSLLVRHGGDLDLGGKIPPLICHSFVRDGQIQFLGDCTHKLAGQTVPLEPF